MALKSVDVIQSMFLEAIARLLPLALCAPHRPVLDAVNLAAFLDIGA